MSSQIDELNRNSRLILLTDTVTAGALGLLKMLLCKSSREKMHVLLYQYNSEDLLNGLPSNVQSKITIHDFASDPLGWLGDGDRCIECDLLNYIQNKCPATGGDQTLIVVDSLSHLISLRSLSYTCQVIHAAAHRRNSTGDLNTQVIAGVHRDLHDPSVLAHLEHTAGAVLSVTPPVNSGFTLSCSILHKKVTGKIHKTTEEFKLGEQFELLECQEVTSALKPTAVQSEVDPTANLTFKLSLGDSEKEARSQTQLPYVYDKLRQSEVLKKSVGEGKIFYQPDEADDFDEDDPDEDLEI